MKKYFLLLVMFWGIQFTLIANPIDDTPIAKFSELVFDNSNNWTMEIYLPFEHNNSAIDSIIINIGGVESKLNISYPDYTSIFLINSDSLITPLSINRNGDKIIIYTFSSIYGQQIRQDSIIFGNDPWATVGVPLMGYSILRFSTRLPSNNYNTIDCLTKNPSLGAVNDTVGISGTLKGHIYNNNNKLITNYYHPMAGQGIFLLESELNLNSDGTYTTPIFNTIYKPGFLELRIVNFEIFSKTFKIDNFELNNIHPDTVVNQDIHLIDTCDYCSVVVDAVEKTEIRLNNNVILINYPNPFNPTTNFYIKIPNNLKGKPANISIFNVNGQLIRKMSVKEGVTAQWNGRNERGRMMASGVYYYSLNINNQSIKTGSMILLK